jgi:HPt (histidine-containing phosphotransfer) domain-containing protein
MFESDDPDFLQSIIGMFVNNTPASISLIRESYTKSEWENLRVAAHKLKPHFNYFMIREAASALQEIEELARNVTDMEKIPALIDIVDRIGSQAIEQMKADHLS